MIKNDQSDRIAKLENKYDSLVQPQDESFFLLPHDNNILTGEHHTPREQMEARFYNIVISLFQSRHNLIRWVMIFVTCIVVLAIVLALATYIWNSIFKDEQPAVIINQNFNVERYIEYKGEVPEVEESSEKKVNEINTNLIERVNEVLDNSAP